MVKNIVALLWYVCGDTYDTGCVTGLQPLVVESIDFGLAGLAGVMGWRD